MDHTHNFQVIRRAIEAIYRFDYFCRFQDLVDDIRLSPESFKRAFSFLVGISLKKYQQSFALDHAKSLLQKNLNKLQTAQEFGSSESSRQDDFFVSWEAMAPRAQASKGDGITIYEGWYQSPFGEVIAMGTDRGICGLGFTSEMGQDVARSDLIKRWTAAHLKPANTQLDNWMATAFSQWGKIDLHLIGTPFQIKVWEALLAIPNGHVTTYSLIADKIGNPKAVRTVATAIGQNPIGFLIPCHRVLRKSGEMGGYHWGLPLKREILAYEGALTDAQ